MFCLRFCAFGIKVIPHPSCYFTTIMDESHHGPFIALFCKTSEVFLAYVGANQLFFTVCY